MVSKAWELRGERVRAEIRRVAFELFAEHGYERVSVADVASAAGMTERTVFRHFATKDALVLDSAGRETWDPLFRLLQSPHTSGTPVQRVREAFATLAPSDHEAELIRMRLLTETPALRMLWRESFRTLESRLGEWLESASAQPLGHADALLVARLIIAAHEHAVDQWLKQHPADKRSITSFLDLEARALSVVEDGAGALLAKRSSGVRRDGPGRP